MDELFKHSYKTSKRETVSLAVYNVGFQRCNPLHQWGPGVRDHYLIHHVISGKGYYRQNGALFEIKAGDTFIVYPFAEVFYYADETEPWEYYWVGFSGGDAKLLLGLTDFSKENPVIRIDFGDALKNALLDIYNSRGQSNADIARMTGKLYIALGLIIEKSKKGESPENQGLYYAKKATEYFAYNYSNPISVEDAADYAKISRSHLYRVFMDNFGISPKRYLTDLRIKQACMLLENSSLSVSAIANSVGFENSLYFSKAFKKAKGISPSQYAEKIKKYKNQDVT